jgi:hypothetical protein
LHLVSARRRVQHNLVLVEDAYDRREPALLPLDYPEGQRGREMAARTSALVTERYACSKPRVRSTRTRCVSSPPLQSGQVQGLMQEFFRMKDIDTDH